MRNHRILGRAVCALALLGLASSARAADSLTSGQPPATGGGADPAVDQAGPVASSNPAVAGEGGIEGYFAHWFDRVTAAQASQPHWITPIVTVTPRLEEEFRYDFGFQHSGNGADLDNFGLGKGLELIPTTSNEVIFNLPPYEDRTIKKVASGLGDDPFFLIKQRFLSANEENGNYILSGFFSVQAPTGIAAFSNNAYVITPTIAGGKGFGPFDFQGTIGVAYPLAHEHTIGTSVNTNIAFQYHISNIFWPEFEINHTYYASGEREGKNQVFVTPGIIFGRFPIFWRLKAIVGVGYQIAVSPKFEASPLTPAYNHQVILTSRVSF